MNPALWGLATALAWGSADFMARITGRALGPLTALAGMFAASAVALTALVLLSGVGFSLPPGAALAVIASGLGIALATLLLYWGLARGPVGVVAPICGSYPAVILAFSIAAGRIPSAPALAMIAVVLAGVVTVARAAPQAAQEQGADGRAFRLTVAIAAAATLVFALSIMVLAEAAARVGELPAVAMGRWVSLAAVLAALALGPAAGRRRVRLAWWPVLLAQGVLDGAAYVALAVGSQGEGGVLAAVVGSAFSAVTVILARIVLKEPMTALQWAGVAAIAGGVMALSAMG